MMYCIVALRPTGTVRNLGCHVSRKEAGAELRMLQRENRKREPRNRSDYAVLRKPYR